MVQLQDSISECLHHHTFFSMLFDETFEAHRARIISCSGLGVSAWLIIRSIFLASWLFSLVFSTTFRTLFGLPHPSIVSILWYACTHLIDPMGIHLLCYAHGNKCTGTHDVIHNTFVAIARDARLHVGQQQLHLLPSTTFNYFCWQVDIVFTNDGFRTLADIVIVDPTRTYLLLRSWLQFKDLLLPMPLKPRKGAITNNTPLINSSP